MAVVFADHHINSNMYPFWLCIATVSLLVHLIQSQTGTEITIGTTWTDDFNQGASGWTITPSPITTLSGTFQYWGPMGDATSNDTVSFNRLFFCSEKSNISTSWSLAYCQTDSADTFTVLLDSTVVQIYDMFGSTTQLSDIEPSSDLHLTGYAGCTTTNNWDYTAFIDTFLGTRNKSVDFEIGFECDILTAAHYALLFNIQINCIGLPTTSPTIDPTIDPTYYPTVDPTVDPTIDPTSDPTAYPTAPSIDPTNDPTFDPTTDPTSDPTSDPTFDPTSDPTSYPTSYPTIDPTSDPTKDPTKDPTTDPTMDPTTEPTTDPTKDPTTDPTFHPTPVPTSAPSASPTYQPTPKPTLKPTPKPSGFVDPTASPVTPSPSRVPTPTPTPIPSFDFNVLLYVLIGLAVAGVVMCVIGVIQYCVATRDSTDGPLLRGPDIDGDRVDDPDPNPRLRGFMIVPHSDDEEDDDNPEMDAFEREALTEAQT